MNSNSKIKRDDYPSTYTTKENDTIRNISRALNLDCDTIVRLNTARFPNLKPSTKFKAGTNVRLPLPEDLEKKNKKKKAAASSSSDLDNKTNDVMFTHSLLKKRAVVVHRALDNETPNQIAKKFNVDVQTLIEANSKRFKGFKANSRLIENTEVIIPGKESNRPLQPQNFKTSVARKSASSDSLMSSDSILDPLSSAKYLKSISSSGDRWSRSKLLKMAESLERVLLSNAAKSKKGGRKRKKKSSSTAKKSFGNMNGAPQTVDGVPIVLGSKVRSVRAWCSSVVFGRGVLSSFHTFVFQLLQKNIIHIAHLYHKKKSLEKSTLEYKNSIVTKTRTLTGTCENRTTRCTSGSECCSNRKIRACGESSIRRMGQCRV